MRYILGFFCLSQMCLADSIVCSFTEPFVTSTYNIEDSTLTYSEDGNGNMTFTNVTFEIKAPGEFSLVGSDGKLLQALYLNNKGSNGMSDTIYPYEVRDYSPIFALKGNYGGCVSNHLPSQEP